MLHNTPELFTAQLQEGHYNELRVALYFMLKGAHVRIGFSGQRYDLHVLPAGGAGFGVEVKWDKRAAETGNLYFEVENTRRREASGIAGTNADYWCHVLGNGDEALLARTSALRSVLSKGNFRSVQTRAQDSNSRGVLVPRSQLVARPKIESEIEWISLPTVDSFFGELFRVGRVEQK